MLLFAGADREIVLDPDEEEIFVQSSDFPNSCCSVETFTMKIESDSDDLSIWVTFSDLDVVIGTFFIVSNFTIQNACFLDNLMDQIVNYLGKLK